MCTAIHLSNINLSAIAGCATPLAAYGGALPPSTAGDASGSFTPGFSTHQGDASLLYYSTPYTIELSYAKAMRASGSARTGFVSPLGKCGVSPMSEFFKYTLYFLFQ